jgi:DNA-directed RNA polymerase sigma subunit (sigma70/sigma32)
MTDEELVARWQKGRDRAALDDLRRSSKPLVQSQVNKYRSNSVPMSVLEAKADQILVESANSFRSGAGAKFKTYLFGNLRRLNRFSTARSNIATIPEARAQKIGVYQRVYEDLKAQKRRPPTASELADELNWPINEIMMMQRSVRMDIVGSNMKAPPKLNTQNAKTKQLIRDIWWELSPDEKLVFEHITGTKGRRKMDKGQDIARATKFSAAKVSQLRSSIARKMEKHL